MKNARQEKILELVEKYEIDTQDALIRRLADAGINATQTTVSRDIKQLKLVKGTTSRGTYKYILPQMRRESGVPVLNSAITDAVTNIEAAENIVVIKTYAGMANAVAVCVDSCGYNEIDARQRYSVRDGMSRRIKHRAVAAYYNYRLGRAGKSIIRNRARKSPGIPPLRHYRNSRRGERFAHRNGNGKVFILVFIGDKSYILH